MQQGDRCSESVGKFISGAISFGQLLAQRSGVLLIALMIEHKCRLIDHVSGRVLVALLAIAVHHASD